MSAAEIAAGDRDVTPTDRASGLMALADKVESGTGADNRIDVIVEVALFEPDEHYILIRANAAGTKVICTRPDGRDATYWAQEWTDDRPATAARLRALSRMRALDEEVG